MARCPRPVRPSRPGSSYVGDNRFSRWGCDAMSSSAPYVDSAAVRALADRAEREGVRLVRFVYVDPSGVTRGKAVHVVQLANRLRGGVGLTRAQNALNVFDELVPIVGMEPVGEI